MGYTIAPSLYCVLDRLGLLCGSNQSHYIIVFWVVFFFCNVKIASNIPYGHGLNEKFLKEINYNVSGCVFGVGVGLPHMQQFFDTSWVPYAFICIVASVVPNSLWPHGLHSPLFMRFSRQEYWRWFPCPPPGDLPDPWIKPISLMSPALAGMFFTTSATWEA